MCVFYTRDINPIFTPFLITAISVRSDELLIFQLFPHLFLVYYYDYKII